MTPRLTELVAPRFYAFVLLGSTVVLPAAAQDALNHYAAGMAAYNRCDYDAALNYFRRAGAGGESLSFVQMGIMYQGAQGVPLDPARALANFRAAAEAGNPSAFFALGQIYTQGLGVERDPAAGHRWYRRSFDYLLGQRNDPSPETAFMLGRHFAKGLGVGRDPSAARRWLTRAADAGLVAAQTFLGEMLLASEDHAAEGLGWLEQAIRAGDPPAMVALASWRLQSGDVEWRNRLGVPRGRALRLLREAAGRGNAEAQYELALRLAAEGGRSNESEAATLMRRAAAKGFAAAQAALGRWHAAGRFVERDAAAAYFRLRLARRLGAQIDEENLRRLGEELSQIELRRVEGRLRSWRAAAPC